MSINNFSRPEQRVIMGNSYNPSWRNHPNLSWGGNQGGGFQSNQGYQSRPYYNQNSSNFVGNQGTNTRDSREQGGMQNLEKLMQTMLSKMDSNQVASEQRFLAIESSINEINVHRKMMENQIAQVAQNIPSSSRLPSQPDPNPKGEMKAIYSSSDEAEDGVVKTCRIEDNKAVELRSGKKIVDPLNKSEEAKDDEDAVKGGTIAEKEEEEPARSEAQE